ncbi:uncharacterized protein N7479_001202 [Penicillium vulpinum]|uniref:uncharacterized protein n=1 Tax=Penicillium vulpinum TaxID=29845 RepID=UPI0025498D44|nr:uncharacterized protein N7479_001202 [Penicillium vulpinum]KAJ5971284.1 hypothetical protein N7479_001202 [Penicillium vulpinum]
MMIAPFKWTSAYRRVIGGNEDDVSWSNWMPHQDPRANCDHEQHHTAALLDQGHLRVSDSCALT